MMITITMFLEGLELPATFYLAPSPSSGWNLLIPCAVWLDVLCCIPYGMHFGVFLCMISGWSIPGYGVSLHLPHVAALHSDSNIVLFIILTALLLKRASDLAVFLAYSRSPTARQPSCY